MKLHELLHYKYMTVFLIRMRVVDREEFKNVLLAYVGLVEACERIFKDEYLPDEYFFERFDYDLSMVARALDYEGIADDIDHEIGRRRKLSEERVKAKMKEMNP